MRLDFSRPYLFIALSLVVPGLALSQTAQAPSNAAVPEIRHDRVERRITDLHDKLHITPSEQSAFDGFAGVMRENSNRADAMMQERGKTIDTMNAIDEMRSYQAMAKLHLDDMQRLVPAFEQLYLTLSPEQKKLADSSFRDFPKAGIRGRG